MAYPGHICSCLAPGTPQLLVSSWLMEELMLLSLKSPWFSNRFLFLYLSVTRQGQAIGLCRGFVLDFNMNYLLLIFCSLREERFRNSENIPLWLQSDIHHPLLQFSESLKLEDLFYLYSSLLPPSSNLLLNRPGGWVSRKEKRKLGKAKQPVLWWSRGPEMKVVH